MLNNEMLYNLKRYNMLNLTLGAKDCKKHHHFVVSKKNPGQNVLFSTLRLISVSEIHGGGKNQASWNRQHLGSGPDSLRGEGGGDGVLAAGTVSRACVGAVGDSH